MPCCAHEGCDTLPSFGSREDGVALYCMAHKCDGDEDVVSKRCAHEGWDTQPAFGSREDGVALYCMAHKRAIDADLITSPNCGYCKVHKRAGDMSRHTLRQRMREELGEE